MAKTYHLLSTFSNCSNKTLCLTFELLNICGAARDEMSRNVDLPNFTADLLTRHELLKMTMMRSARWFWFIYYAFSRCVVTLRNYFMNYYKMKDDWWINMTWKPRRLKRLLVSIILTDVHLLTHGNMAQPICLSWFVISIAIHLLILLDMFNIMYSTRAQKNEK